MHSLIEVERELNQLIIDQYIGGICKCMYLGISSFKASLRSMKQTKSITTVAEKSDQYFTTLAMAVSWWCE